MVLIEEYGRRIIIFWRIDPFLGNDREANNKITAFAADS
jgi:hypothetical protein